MIMFPTQKPHKQQQQQQQRYDGYGYGGCREYSYFPGYGGGSFDHMRYDQNSYNEAIYLESDIIELVGNRCQRLQQHHMAEDESRTSSVNEAGSSSRDPSQQDQKQGDEKWLQLGLGNSVAEDSELNKLKNKEVLDEEQPTPRRDNKFVELDLLSGNSTSGTQDVKSLTPIFHMTSNDFRPNFPPFRSGIHINNNSATGTRISMPYFIHHHQQSRSTSLNLSTHNHHLQPEHHFAWAAAGNSSYNRSNVWNPTVGTSASPLPLMSNSYNYLRSPTSSFQQHPNVDIAGPSSSTTSDNMMMKVIDTPPRPQSGIWFVLQASPNQSKEPFLPQIPKSYLRIKDGRMPVRLLMKYLANKLRLNGESEIEIRCRGQQLDPFLTLQHVRDHIWNRKDDRDQLLMMTLLQDASATTSTDNHVMILHYDTNSNTSSTVNRTTTP